jgi:shikimate dehydrogenase
MCELYGLMRSKAAMSDYKITPKDVPTFYFIGVTTGKSSIMKIFPRWARELGRPEVVIEGVDLKIHDDPEAYRQAVAQIKYDPLSLGGLVTTHKIDLLNAARDMFTYLDGYAITCGEISSISKRDSKLEGHAKDPISSGLSLDAVLGENYFDRTGGEVLCFGAGGSAVAIALHLMNKKQPGDRPQRFVVVNRTQPRLAHLKEMVESQGTNIEFEYIHNQDPARNDEIMAGMTVGSLVINATGMGKDTPGSPITEVGLFPQNSIVWELNYRGELDFMHQALAQVASRNVTVEDGWLYFLHGWTQVIAQVFHMPIDGELFKRLAEVAEVVRP